LDMGQKLTKEEIKKIGEYAKRTADQSKGPVHSVVVQPELDDDGKTHFTVLHMNVVEKPKGWKPS